MNGRWPTKEQDRQLFIKLFPYCLEKPPEMSSKDKKALNEIMRYWTIGYIKAKMRGVEEGWMKQKGDPNDIFVFEAHSTAEDIMKVYMDVGFIIDTKDIEALKEKSNIDNPHFLLLDSGILAGMIAQKPLWW
ncbi:MAG: hypothetical protein QXD48_02050 [Candidatus Aenigmatarchaeota archaeon]